MKSTTKILCILFSVIMIFQLTGCANKKATTAYEHLKEAENLINARVETLYEAVTYGRSITKSSTGICSRFADILGCSEQELKEWDSVFEGSDSKLANAFSYYPDSLSIMTCYIVYVQSGEYKKFDNELEAAKNSIMEIENDKNGLYEELMNYYECLKEFDDNFPESSSDKFDKSKIEEYQMNFKKYRLAIEDKM